MSKIYTTALRMYNDFRCAEATLSQFGNRWTIDLWADGVPEQRERVTRKEAEAVMRAWVDEGKLPEVGS